MPYILNKTNGNVLTTLEDSSVDVSTSLTFVGKNYSGYGESVNENFLKLLENFSNSIPPDKPILGQIWFNSNSDTRRLEVCYDGKNFKGVASLRVQSATPSSNLQGDLWWDSTNKQLKAYDGSAYVVVGPVTSKTARSSWAYDEEKGTDNTDVVTYPVMKGKVGGVTILTIAKLGTESKTFVPDAGSNIYSDINPDAVVKKGITLVGADKNTGSSIGSGYYFWGTAADALTASTATTVKVTSTTTNQSFYVPFVSTISGGTSLAVNNGVTFNPSTGVLNTVASSARFADLAERYEADGLYEFGTVVVIGGSKEITLTHTHADTAVAGIISKNPAYLMNSDAGNNDTHPYVALRGRVLCKVIGKIKKGDLLVTSSYPGYAEAIRPTDKVAAIVAKSLEDFDGAKGMIEVLV